MGDIMRHEIIINNGKYQIVTIYKNGNQVKSARLFSTFAELHYYLIDKNITIKK